MVYRKLSNEELQAFPYPNLIAELIESGYSICTLGDHMGIGSRCKEDDPEVWARLRGEKEILASEAAGLARLFNVNLEYLFGEKLNTMSGKSFAYYRWYDWNRKMEEQSRVREAVYEISWELREKPYLLDFVQKMVRWSEAELRQAIALLEEAKQHKAS